MIVSRSKPIPAAPRDPKRLVNEILKQVDQLIKRGEIDQSVRLIIQAREIDPKHGYIGAYEERLVYLKEEHEKNIVRERTRKQAEEAARIRDEELRRQHELERQRIADEQKRLDTQRRSEENRLKGDTENPPPARVRQMILVVDDEIQMLDTIGEAINYAGYEARKCQSADQAYEILKNWSPDLILCDVNLVSSTMGGFDFYEKVRKLEHLERVPFVFLTGMSDKVLMRTAKQMGADDYLLKPISIENLLSTVRGKLRRYTTLK